MPETRPEPPLGPRHPEVERIRRLLRRAADRSSEGAFVIEGPTLVRAALEAGAPIEAVYVDAESLLTGGRPGAGSLDQLARDVGRDGVPVRRLAAGVLARVADVVTPQGVLAVCASVAVPPSSIETDGFVLVGVGIGDPGNAGTMIRTADATGAAAIAFTGDSVDVHGPKVVRSAAGSMFHLPVVVGGKASGVETADLLVALARNGRVVLGAAAGEGEPCDRIDLSGNVAFVVGNESRGLPAGLPLDGLVHVPMAGRAESLNVAMAATILCYEAARQRRGRASG